MKLIFQLTLCVLVLINLSRASPFLDDDAANEFLESSDPIEKEKRSIFYTGKEQRREAKVNYESKCERKLLSAYRKKPRWCPELETWPEWVEVTRKDHSPSLAGSSQTTSVNKPLTNTNLNMNPFANPSNAGNPYANRNPYPNANPNNNPFRNVNPNNNPYGNGFGSPYGNPYGNPNFLPQQRPNGNPYPYPNQIGFQQPYPNQNQYGNTVPVNHRYEITYPPPPRG